MKLGTEIIEFRWILYAFLVLTCIFLESWALRFRRCAPDQGHRHIDFIDFQQSGPGPSQAQSEFGEFQLVSMAAEENTELCKFIGRHSVW